MTFTNIRKMPSTGDNIYQNIVLLLTVSLLMTGAYALSRKRWERN